MKKIGFLVAVLAFPSITSHAETKIDITLKHNSKEEVQTRDQLQRLLKSYDLSKWIFTDSIVIDEESIPHSNPVLTLSTRHLKDDELLVSTFVHEQLHRFFQRNNQTDEAINELRVLFPKAPVGFPEGAEDEYGTYVHLLVNFFEWRADRDLFGELRARQIMDFWATDHYRWVYKTVLERPRDIWKIASKYKLIPPHDS